MESRHNVPFEPYNVSQQNLLYVGAAHRPNLGVAVKTVRRLLPLAPHSACIASAH